MAWVGTDPWVGTDAWGAGSATPKLGSLVEGFDANTGQVTNLDANRRIVGGALEVDVTTAYYSVAFPDTYDATESEVIWEVRDYPEANGSIGILFNVSLSTDNSSRVAYGWNDGAGTFREHWVGGTQQTTTYAALPTGGRFYRIRATAGGGFDFSVSVDGVAWTVQAEHAVATPGFDLASVTTGVTAGYWRGTDTAPVTPLRIERVGPSILAYGPNTTISFGAGTPNSPGSADLAELNTAAGEDPTVELWYRNWTQAITVADLDLVRGRGHLSELTWEFFDGTGPTNATYTYANLLAGNFDAYITETATTLRDWGHPIYLRLFHEVNGNWYPWCVGVNGNSAQQHKDAWTYVRNIFTTVGATNVLWSWSPNVSHSGSTPYANIYPGDASVDVVAFDGYNWGDGSQYATDTSTSWVDPSALFGPSFTEMRALTSTKPFWIGETGSAELGGDKAAWIDTLFRWLTNQAEVEALVWFHHNKERDWRISSSTAAANAFKAGLAQVTDADLTPAVTHTFSASGASASAGTATLVLAGSVAASGASASSGSATAALILRGGLSASGASSSAGSAAVALATTASASGASVSSGSAQATAVRSVAAQSAASSVGVASLTLEAALAAQGAAVSSGSAEFPPPGDYSASGSSVSSGAAAVSARLVLVASGASSSIGAASVRLTLVFAVAGTSTTTGSATVWRIQHATATGTSTSSGAAAITARYVLTATGLSAATGSAQLILRLLLAASGVSASSGAAFFSGAIGISAGGSSNSAGAAIVAALRTIVAAGLSTSSGFAQSAGVLSLQALGSSSSFSNWASIVRYHDLSAVGGALSTGGASIVSYALYYQWLIWHGTHEELVFLQGEWNGTEVVPLVIEQLL